jgi:hypothetical protein
MLRLVTACYMGFKTGSADFDRQWMPREDGLGVRHARDCFDWRAV